MNIYKEVRGAHHIRKKTILFISRTFKESRISFQCFYWISQNKFSRKEIKMNKKKQVNHMDIMLSILVIYLILEFSWLSVKVSFGHIVINSRITNDFSGRRRNQKCLCHFGLSLNPSLPSNNNRKRTVFECFKLNTIFDETLYNISIFLELGRT